MIFTKEELRIFITEQNRIFDIVRLVDVSMTRQYTIDNNGEFIEAPYECYNVWNKKKRCDCCISSKVLLSKKQFTKFEFIGDDIYFVIALYVEVEGNEYSVELVAKFTDETLFAAYGKEEFARTIQSYNNKIYKDSLTNAYNRRYFEEQLKHLRGINAIVVLDLDDFKKINDTYGHIAGDEVLKEVVKVCDNNIRSVDVIVRWGGDEFVLLFLEIPEKIVQNKLEIIRKSINDIYFDKYQNLKILVSMGCVVTEHATNFFEEADQALYEGKKKGNSIVIRKVDS